MTPKTENNVCKIKQPKQIKQKSYLFPDNEEGLKRQQNIERRALNYLNLR